MAFVAVAGVLIGVSTVWREGDTTKLDQHTLRRLTVKDEFLNRKFSVVSEQLISCLVLVEPNH